MAEDPTYEKRRQRIKESEKNSNRRIQKKEVPWEDETMFRVAFEQVPVGMCLVNPDGRFLNVNGSICHMLGYTKSELLSKTFLDITHPDDLDTSTEWVHNLLAGKATIVDLEKRYLHKEGHVVWGTVRAFLLRNIDGSPRFFVTHLRDITERKQAEEALMEREELFRAIFNNAGVGIAIANKDKVFTLVNDRMAQMLGTSKDELIGASNLDITHPEDIELSRNRLESLFQGEVDSYRMEKRYLRKDGSDLWIDLSVSNIRDKEGKTEASIGMCTDISDKKRAEETLVAVSTRQKALLESIPDIIMEVDVNKTYTWANQSGFDFFGEDVIGKKASHYFAGEQDTYELVSSLFNGDENVTYVESWQRRKDGEKRLLAWWCRVLKDGQGNVTGALSSARDVTLQKQMEVALSESEKKYRDLYDQAPVGYMELDSQGKIVRVNRRILEILGYTAGEILGRHPWEFVVEKEAQETVLGKLAGVLPPAMGLERTYRRKDGTTVPVIIDDEVIRDENGLIVGNRSTVQDISQRKQAEAEKEKLQAQLNLAQKMESVGRLAGGVAHDFNNKLGIIIGNVEMAMMEVSPADPHAQNLQEIQKAAQHSADLVRQLLAFARKQTVSPKVLDLNDTVSSLMKMLQRLIGEEIGLAWMPGHNLWPIKIDPSQVDQILANLAVNAKDAIAGVGNITIETANVVFDEAYCADRAGFVPGQYVLLSVSDDGVGMSKGVLEHLFEPFFTTKEVGKGTGLGLSTIYGIVKQNMGFINVYSEPGKGTTIKIYLPRFEAESVEIQRESKPDPLVGGTETVLMVEDEKAILNVGKAMVKRLGYNVLTASSPSEALRLVREYTGRIHLVLTDVVMPEMNGHELVEKLKGIYPSLKCLYTSGYTANVIAHRGVLEEGVNFIQKPFSMKDLAIRLREVLDKE